MKITPEQNQELPLEQSSNAANHTKSERVSTPSSMASEVERAAAASGTTVVPPVQRQSDVTFRRDNNGRIYYVVSDSRSGEEILEVPPKTVREVGQGIEEFLKQEQSKAGTHLETKA